MRARYHLFLLLISVRVCASHSLKNEVITFSEGNDTVFADKKFIALYNTSTNTFRAFDVTDSGLAELARAKEIYQDLKDRYLYQNLIEKSGKDRE